MKITLENPDRMVLKDHNITEFLGGIVFLVVGIVIAYFGMKNILLIGFGLLFAVIGAYLFVKTVIVKIVLDKTQNKCNVSIKGIMKHESKEVQLSDLNQVILNTELGSTHSRKGGTKRYYQYILVLVLKNGEELPFEFGKVNASIMDTMISPHDRKKADAQKIADFIGVGLKYNEPPSLKNVIDVVGKQIDDAIKQKMQKEQSI